MEDRFEGRVGILVRAIGLDLELGFELGLKFGSGLGFGTLG